MAKVTTAQISDDVLASKVETSDRLVYSNYFVPFLVAFDDGLTPIIPFYVKHQLLDLVAYGGLNVDRLQDILGELKAPELWGANQMDAAREHWHSTSIVASSDNPGGVVRRLAGDGLNSVARDIQETAGLLAVLKGQLDTSGQEVLHLAEGRLTQSMRDLAERAAADRGASAQPSVLGNQDAEVVAGLLQSQIGYGFLDRTRISPIGFGIGEHVFALGLAPGEEVVLEQKTFTKRQVTFEEETDQERQFDIELSSTYSTELQEGFERQRARHDQWDVHYTKNWSYASPLSIYGTWATDNNFNYNKSVTAASQEVRRRSVKENQQASGKISARYRAQHKTVFRVTTERGYEASARRTIRNPNRTTPLTLHFFKALQRLRLRQERYGVRLCWAPAVNAPGFQMLSRLRAGRQRILDEVMAKLPPRPKEPSAPSDGTSTKREEKTLASAVMHADQHNWTAGQNHDYDVEVTIPQGWSWDENTQNVRIDTSASLRTAGTYSVYKIGIPVLSEGGVLVRVHVDAGDRAGAQPIYFQVTIIGVKDVSAPPGTTQNATYLAALEDWRTEVGEWEAARQNALAQADAAAVAFEKAFLAEVSPVDELVSQVIARWFPPSVRDDAWEIDFWHQLFDWERASFTAFPGWWSGEGVRDPLRSPSDFINASWAKLYLPVRIGMERQALRWIFGKSLARPLSAVMEKRFDAIIDDLRKFRADFLGAADEVAELTEPCQAISDPFTCLAEWTEVMPAEGTHIEVVQGTTSAADEITAAEIKAAADLREALLENEKANARIKKKALDQMTEAAKVVVTVGTDGGVDARTT